MKALFDLVGISFVAAGCTHRCRHCSASASESEAELLSLDQIEGVINALRRENEKSPPFCEKASPCLLYEPMYHPHIVEIQRLFYELNPDAPLVRTMATNGHRIGTDPQWKEVVEGVRRWGVERFQLTVHGLEEHHDWFTRRQGSFAEIMEAARRLAAVSAPIDWVYFLDRRNVAELPEAISAAREAARGTHVEESINVWGPAGRASRAEGLLPRAADLELLPSEVREMGMLPQYLPESEWVRLARDGSMQRMFEEFTEKVRREGGIRPCNLRVTRQNVDGFAEMLLDARQRGARLDPEQEPEPVDLARLATEYADAGGDGLYRVATMVARMAAPIQPSQPRLLWRSRPARARRGRLRR